MASPLLLSFGYRLNELITRAPTHTLSSAMIALSRPRSFSTAAVTVAPAILRLIRHSMGRLYNTVVAAQPQLDPDYYPCDDYYDVQSPSSCYQLESIPMAETEGSVPERGVQWAFIGNPRANRHVYAEMISKLLEVPHISMANIVRQELSPRSSLYKQIADALDHGELVPEHIIFALLSERLKNGYYRGFILDGIPRTHIQAEMLDRFADIDLVLNFKYTEDFLMKNYGENFWKEKFQAYYKQSKAVEEYYRKKRKLIDFQVSSVPKETWQGLLTVLGLRNVDAALDAQNLTPGSSLP